jgi:hypothetical protein
MTTRFKWLGVITSLVIILSVTLVGLTTGVKAAAPKHSHVAAAKTSAKSHASNKVTSRCKTRVKAKGTVKWSDWQFPDTFSVYTGGNLAVTALNTNFIYDGLLFYNNKV